MNAHPSRHHPPLSLQEAAQASPVLARLSELSRESQARLLAIRPILPAVLHFAVQAGPIEGRNWCLIVKNNAAAAKIRQLIPAFEAQLRIRGLAVDSIRIKVQSSAD
ncbi:hypothetical protein [Hylemonella gracilis]|uniref:hypothetical protein n=1 Tax=Hylemonella gracilis TaxID=80880 RepID=UPI0009DA5186|nr:hypothetical protein [Hylemonella gracilis]